MTARVIKLLLVKPNTSMVKIRPKELITIQVRVIGKNLDSCFLSINYKVDYLEMTKGAALTSLGEGSFTKNHTWILKALKNTRNSLFVEINAESNGLFQTAGFKLKIIE